MEIKQRIMNLSNFDIVQTFKFFSHKNNSILWQNDKTYLDFLAHSQNNKKINHSEKL